MLFKYTNRPPTNGYPSYGGPAAGGVVGTGGAGGGGYYQSPSFGSAPPPTASAPHPAASKPYHQPSHYNGGYGGDRNAGNNARAKLDWFDQE